MDPSHRPCQNLAWEHLRPGLLSLHLLGSSLRPLVCCGMQLVMFIELTNLHIVDSIVQSDEPLPSPKTVTSSRSASPALSNNGRKFPFQKLSRSQTTPLSGRPPSPDITIAQDCAFPHFPTSKSRSATPTPTTPLESAFTLPLSNNRPQGLDRGSSYASVSPRATGGGSLLQRMNSIAPGPFSGRGDQRQSGHEKSGSMSSSRDFIWPTSSSGSKSHHQRPTTSSSVYTRKPSQSISSTSGSNRFTFDPKNEDVPTIPAMPPPPQRPSREDNPVSTRNASPLKDSGFDFGSFGQEQRSSTFPTDEISRSEEQASMQRRPSEPSVKGHKSKPSVAAGVMQPLYEIGSTSSFKPSRSIREHSRSVSRTDARDDRRLQDAPPVPLPSQAQIVNPENPYHTPHESTSSNGSYSSGVKSGSSRSSPPINESPLRLQGHSSDNSQIDNLFNGFQFDVDKRPSFEEPPAFRDQYGHGPPKPRPTNVPIQVRPATPPAQRDEPQRRPSIPTLSPPAASPDEYIVSSFAPQSNNLRASPVPLLSPPSTNSAAPRPTTANKGNCRGCGDLIIGKSVSSADGRLTGRYHKACFVCKTCQAPFQTADFYVMNNNPYCARHYHELNHSLCTKCDRGIEGQYLETDSRLKFHPHCFSCQECHRILRDDCFEWDGRTLCEQHAFGAAQRAAQQPSSLGPGRRYPERRTTRLMMM